MEKRELAFNLYKDSNGEKPLKDIALEVEASPGTVRGWKSRYKWDELIGKSPPKKECNVAKEKRSATRNVTTQPVIENDDLKDQQKMFCLFYLQHFNATKAYQQAYQCAYSTAKTNGNLLLTNTDIKKELHRLKAELQQDTFVDVKDLIQEYVKQAFADMADFTEFGQEVVEFSDGSQGPVSFVRLKDSDKVDGTLIQEVKKGKDGVSVKLYDKQKAMSELMKYLGGDALRQAQLNKLSGPKEGEASKDWKQAVINAANKRVVDSDG